MKVIINHALVISQSQKKDQNASEYMVSKNNTHETQLSHVQSTNKYNVYTAHNEDWEKSWKLK